MIGSARYFAVIFNLSVILLIKTKRFEQPKVRKGVWTLVLVKHSLNLLYKIDIHYHYPLSPFLILPNENCYSSFLKFMLLFFFHKILGEQYHYYIECVMHFSSPDHTVTQWEVGILNVVNIVLVA